MALQELRRRGVTALCVDFLCINQSDKEEKSNQVLMMDKIFGQARTVFAWLLPFPPGVEYVLEVLKSAAKGVSFDEDLNSAMAQGLGDALNEVCANPYWRRIWIIQELAKARNVLVLWSHHEFQWKPLSNALASENLKYFLTKPRREVFSALQAFRLREKNIYIDPQRLTLLEALVQSRHALATDPRDKIFALLNLTSDGQDLVPFLNYSQTIPQICQDIAVGIIVRQQKTAAILLAKRKAKPAVEGIPTWVPDWSSLATNPPEWILSSLNKKRQSDVFEFVNDGTKLTLPCKEIGNILATLRRPDPLTSESWHIGHDDVQGGDLDIIAGSDGSFYDDIKLSHLSRRYKVSVRHALSTQYRLSIQAMGGFVRVYLQHPPTNEPRAVVKRWIKTNAYPILSEAFAILLLVDVAHTINGVLESLAPWYGVEYDRVMTLAGTWLLNQDGLSLVISNNLDVFVASCDPNVNDRVVEVPHCPLPLVLGPVEEYYEYLGEVVFSQPSKGSSEDVNAKTYYDEQSRSYDLILHTLTMWKNVRRIGIFR